MAFWDYSLGQATTDIFGLLKVKEESKAAIAASQAQIDASERTESRADVRAFASSQQVQFLIIAGVVALLGIALIRKGRG